MIQWLKSLFTKRCDHWFEYNQVIDLNNSPSTIKCVKCNKPFTVLAKGKSAEFKYVPAPRGSDVPGHYTIEFSKTKISRL